MNKEEAFARFKQALGYLEDKKIITKYGEMAANLGMKEPALSNAMQNKDRRFSKGFIKRFAHAYSDYISEEWLLTGEGEMARPDRNMRPHYDAKASAGFMDGISEGKMSAEFRAMAIPALNYDFSIDTKGDSMLPRIEAGDILLCRVANDRLNPPIGKICVIDTKDGFIVKEIMESGEDSIIVHSLNPAYSDYAIDHSNILGTAEVVGILRSFV